MKKTIFVYCSPLMETDAGSIVSKALDRFKKTYLSKNDDEIVEINLNNLDVGTTPLTSNNFSTFFTDGISDKYVELLKGANKLVIATPMINFNYPSVLKNFLDHILVPGKTFKYKYDGKGTSIGLLDNLTVKIILTQGAPTGWYSFASHNDSLRGTLDFAGMKLTDSILIDGTKAPENIKKTIEEHLSPYIDIIDNHAMNF